MYFIHTYTYVKMQENLCEAKMGNSNKKRLRSKIFTVIVQFSTLSRESNKNNKANRGQFVSVNNEMFGARAGAEKPRSKAFEFQGSSWRGSQE